MAQIVTDWRRAPLDPAHQALCLYAEKLTKQSSQMNDGDIEALRNHGFDDQAIHDATQVIGYFNYINRVADALNVDQENDLRPWEKQGTA